MRFTGGVLVIAGIALLLVAFFGIDTAPRGTHNVGLLQGQMLVFQLGCVAFLAGVILSGFGGLSVQLGRRQERVPEPLAKGETHATPLAADQTNTGEIIQALWFGGAIVVLATVGAIAMMIFAEPR